MTTQKNQNDTASNPVILVVDDTPRNIKLIGEVLKNNVSCDLAIASNGSEALVSVQELKPDLILLDVMMPDISGYEVCRQLKEDRETASIPIIFLTARSDETDIVKGFECGAVDYVTKPFNRLELVARVRTQLELTGYAKAVERNNQELQQLLHVLCHDLLNSVGGIDSMLENFGEQELLQCLPDMKRATENAVGLIEMVRELRAYLEGKKSLAMKPVNLSQAVHSAKAITRQLWKAKNVSIEIEGCTECCVQADVTALVNSVLSNLLTNAVKFSPRAAVVVVKIKKTDGAHVQLTVEDRGIGMSPELQQKIFDLGQQTSRTGTDGEMGTGFGMPLVKHFIEMFGGTIRIESCDESRYPDAHGTRVIIDFLMSS